MNVADIADLLRTRGRSSRAELARASGLSKPTVSSLIENLASAGIVQQAGSRAGRPGRAPILYEIRKDLGWVLGGEIRGSRLRLAVSRTGDPGHTAIEGNLTCMDEAQTAALLSRMINNLTRSVAIGPEKLIWAAFAVRDVTPDAEQPRRQRDYLTGALHRVFGDRHSVERATNMAALAEYLRRGWDRGQRRSLALVSVAEVIDAGFVLCGNLHRGAHDRAGRAACLVEGDMSSLDPAHPPDDPRMSGQAPANPGGTRAGNAHRRPPPSGPMVGSRTATANMWRGSGGRGWVVYQRNGPQGWAADPRHARLVAGVLVRLIYLLDPDALVLDAQVARPREFRQSVERELSRMVPWASTRLEAAAWGEDTALSGCLALAAQKAWQCVTNALSGGDLVLTADKIT